MGYMKKIILILISALAFAQSPFETPAPHEYVLSMFNTNRCTESKKASENEKIKCRYVCDKKIYKEQVIADAINFYTNSKDYSFKVYSSSK